MATIPIKQNAYKGLDTRRNNDSKWKKLFKKIQQIKLLFNDHVLSIMIDDYLKWSYGISGCIWLTDLFRKISVDIIPTKYLESQAYNPNIELENTITRLRGKIINHIEYLQSTVI